MSRFRAATQSTAVVTADRDAVWAALTDPDLLARLTPFLRTVRAEGDHWHWEMTRIPVLGASVVPTFTERMTFDEPRRIDFRHDPPAGASEPTGVEGWYELAEAERGTHLSTSLEVCVDLPLPRFSSPAVTTAMKGVLGTMGRRFSHNLLNHLGAEQV